MSGREKVSSRPSRFGVQSDPDVHDYVTKASDPLGRSVTVSVSVAPDIRRLMAVILTSQKFPFETEQDVHRYALIEGLKKLEKKAENKEVSAALSTVRAWLNTAKFEAEMLFYGVKLDALETTICTLIEAGHPVRGEILAEQILKEIGFIEDPYWRTRYEKKSKMLLDRTRRLMARKKKEQEKAEAEAREAGDE